MTNTNETHDRTVFELAEAAFQQAAKKVIERAKVTSTPIILWIDDKPQECDPWEVEKISVFSIQQEESPKTESRKTEN